ncbi:MAG: GAF domain-containing protein [Anaerolineae bacterium]|nr:GAF domain-containing protein [Anaerolineae bacterium]
MFGQWSLRRRLTVAVVLYTAVSLIVIVLLILNIAVRFVGEQTQDALTALNRSTAAAITGELRSVETLTYALGGVLDGQRDSILSLWQTASYSLRQPDVLVQRIGTLQPVSGGYRLNLFRRPLTVTAPRQKNTVRAIPAELAPLVDLALSESVWFYSADPYGTTRTPSLIYALRLPGTRGYIWAEITGPRLSEWLETLTENSPYPYGAVVTTAEQVFAAGGMGAAALTDPQADLLPLMSQAVTGYAMMEDTPYDTGSLYVINTPLLDGTWNVIGLVSEEDVSDESDEELLQIVFLILVVIGALGWLLDRFAATAITTPLVDLTTTAQEIGSGDMRYQVGYQNRRDEVGGLARSLEDMKSNLADSLDSLSMWSRTLEKRVADRTNELQVAQTDALSRAAELRAVYDASLSVVSEYYLNIILSTLTGRVVDLLQASYSGIWLVTEDRAGLQLVASTSDDAGTIGRTIGVHDGLAGKVVETAEWLVIEDYVHWEGRLGWVAPYIERALAVPLMYSGEPIGAIVAGRAGDAPNFSADDARLLTLLANLVSPVVRSAQLYGQLDIAMQKANSANEVKTRFLASVTHELRTPLNLIINNLDFMRIGSFGKVNEEQRKRLDQTVRSAELLLYLINDLLDVSKIEAGEMQLYFQPAEVRPIIEDALDSTLAQMDAKRDVSLEIDMPETLPTVVMDARRIRQVLLNLLSNAVKFTPAGEVRFTIAADADSITFTVKDSGIGIPEDELPNIFEAFQRSTRAKAMGIEGTGLGLPISRHLVEAHGGTLTVETEIGAGSTFTVRLPLVPPQTPRTPQRALQLGAQQV